MQTRRRLARAWLGLAHVGGIPSALFLKKREIEFHVALAHAIEAEVFLCELEGVAAQLLAKSGVG